MREQFEIRIRPDGKIVFQGETITGERLRLLREMLEDCLGPVEIISGNDGSSPDRTGLTEKEKTSLKSHPE